MSQISQGSSRVGVFFWVVDGGWGPTFRFLKSAQNRAASTLWVSGHCYKSISCPTKLIWVYSNLKSERVEVSFLSGVQPLGVFFLWWVGSGGGPLFGSLNLTKIGQQVAYR